jgi:hypothetical protein
VSKCEIAQSFCKKSFDHKNIALSFKKEKKEAENVLTIVYWRIRIWTAPLS